MENTQNLRFLPFGAAKYQGEADFFAKFIEEYQLKNTSSWEAFVKVFERGEDDADLGWRCEFFGKMMRGAALTYMYTASDELYAVLEEATRALLSKQSDDGAITTYSKEMEFEGWDLWGRKYVLTGLLHFYKICKDEQLKADIVAALSAHADAILAHVGEGKKPITRATEHWLGVNSCSILEPFVELYKLTKEERYLDFAKYIISTGGVDGAQIIERALAGNLGSFKKQQLDIYVRFLDKYVNKDCLSGENLIKIALEDKLYPYEYPETKAYETMSFFEGLLAYFEVTGEEEYLVAVRKFMDRIAETDITVIGCSGCTHELFDNSSKMQTEFSDMIMQETCVTVTWMRVLSRLFSLTGDVRYADLIEKSAVNAMWGSVNTEKQKHVVVGSNLYIDPLPFDSYAPLVRNVRGRGVGGLKEFSFGGNYGCCACIGSAGTAIYPLGAVMVSDREVLVNYMLDGEVSCEKFNLSGSGDCARSGKYRLSVSSFADLIFKIRIPDWTDGASVSVNGKDSLCKSGYLEISAKAGEKLEVEIDLKVKLVAHELNGKHALTYGPFTLSLDEGLSEAKEIAFNENTVSSFEMKNPLKSEILRFEATDENGKKIVLTDYASSGKKWFDSPSKISVWF